MRFALILLVVCSVVFANTVDTTTTLVRGWQHSDEMRGVMKRGFHGHGKEVMEGFHTKLNPLLEKIAPLMDENLVEVTHMMLPMRDGVKLSTYIVRRKDGMSSKKSTLLARSPYGPTTDQIANLFLAVNGMVAVIQDQRGTFRSEGEYSMWHHDAEDGFDTLAWIEKQAWSNGKVFTAGASADGIGSGAMILSQPKQLKGQVLMWATLDGFGTVYPGGVFREGLITGWMTMMSVLTRGVSLSKVLPDILAHSELGEWWEPIQGPGHYHQANWPTIHISGWWDIFQGHQIDMFNQLTKLSNKHDHYLIVGPMGHCILDKITDGLIAKNEFKALVNSFGLATELFAEENEVKGTSFQSKMKKINVFVQRGGEEQEKTYWSSFDTWPKTRPHYLMFGSSRHVHLTTSVAMTEGENHSLRKLKFYEFGFDPITPIITEGGNNLILIMMGLGCGSVNQKVNEEERLDALVFTTPEPLKEDLTMVGHVKAVVFVSTKGKDADVFVSLNDVYIDPKTGKEVSMQIRFGIQRLKARDSTSEASKRSPVNPDEVYEVEVDMWFTAYVVPKGHRLRVVISSSSSPYYAVNLDGGNMVTWNRIHWSTEHPSRVELPVVDASDVPENRKF